MDKRELQQLKAIKQEIIQLQRQLDNITVEPRTVSDIVTGSSSYHPYSLRRFKISGVDIDGYDRRVQRLQNAIKRQVDMLMDKVTEAQEYIANVPDSEIRQILQCRYINGLTWEQIEEETGINDRTARRKFKVWFEQG